MASYLQARQPFASLDGPRLQALGSVKNRQNAIPVAHSFSSPIKPTFNTPTKRRHASPDVFDEFDSENVDPNLLLTPSKRTKGLDGSSISKPSKFILTTDASKPTALATPPVQANTSAKRKASLSLSVPAPSTSTPIAHSRGSPKHKRVGLLSRKLNAERQRRFSSSPFRRVDPPSTSGRASLGSTALPFSIDAALSGTISSYSAAPNSNNEVFDLPALSNAQKSMPPSWFFAIHADTADDEAANLMEHSAAVLDISSDDDAVSKRRRDDEERGKENVPPPEWVAPVRAARGSAASGAAGLLNALLGNAGVHRGVSDKVRVAEAKASARVEGVEDMLEDRAALAALDERDFYPEGLDERSVEVVGEEKEKVHVEAEVVVDDVKVEAEVQTEAVTEVAVVEALSSTEEIVVCEDSL